MKQSNFLSLNWRDFLRGLLIAILTPVFATITTSLEAGVFTLNWHLIAISSIGGALAYLSKNLLTKPEAKAFAEEKTPPIIGGRPDER